MTCLHMCSLNSLLSRHVSLQGDIYLWAALFSHFDALFEKHIKHRPDIQLDSEAKGPVEPFPTQSVEAILRVTGTILENCSNKHNYDSYEVSLPSASSTPMHTSTWDARTQLTSCLHHSSLYF